MPSSTLNDLSQSCVYGDFVSSTGENKSRFGRWLSKLFNNGSDTDSEAISSHHPKFLEEEAMVFRTPVRFVGDRPRSEREKNELDRAIALSLAEDLNRPPIGGFRWNRDNGEDIARKIHERFSSSFYPPFAPTQHYSRGGFRLCSACNRDVGHGNYLGCMGNFYHPECFRCHACGSQIIDHEFSLSGKKTYHKSCFKEMSHPRCDVCHHFIPANGAGLIEYRCHPYWSQKYCPSHEHDNTARCCSCERLESGNARYVALGDGRSLCLECMESAVMDTSDCQTLYHSIRDYYEGLNMKIDQQIPMLLVQRQALNEAIVGEKHGYHHMPETRGLCLSEEQTVSSVLRRPMMGVHRLMGMRTQPQRLTRRCEVTAILVLYGLPRLLTGAILAHELMHAWLRLKGFRNLRPEVEEGICQVLSYMWLESEVMTTSSSSSSSAKKGARSNTEDKIGQFFKHQIEHEASPTYGDGYRAAKAAVNKFGLRATLEHIKSYGSIPF